MQRRVYSFALGAALAFAANVSWAQQAQAPMPTGVYAFGPDQTIADIGKMEWAPLKLDGLPEGIEIAALRGDLAKGGGEILLRTPPRYVVPNHSHTSDELYVWGASFGQIARKATRADSCSAASSSKPNLESSFADPDKTAPHLV